MKTAHWEAGDIGHHADKIHVEYLFKDKNDESHGTQKYRKRRRYRCVLMVLFRISIHIVCTGMYRSRLHIHILETISNAVPIRGVISGG